MKKSSVKSWQNAFIHSKYLKTQQIKGLKMAEPRAFISFDVDHNSSDKILFAGQAWHSKTPFSHEDWSAKSPMPQSQWEAIVREKINKTHLLIVLAGRHMATATGVVKEIEMARSQNVPIFGVYVDSANNTSPLPTGLNRNRVIAWTWEGIANAVTQMMGEGKNLRK
ncbi:TIR domain-containing protein [Pseudomonas sp. 2835]|uniref:TIR domain-containing protein n=1 Tax=Pseudomonas sp. 2835 TaxID=3156451 RepID=UPI003D2169E7